MTCPLCLDVMIDPTTLQCGHTACRACVITYFENTCRSVEVVPPFLECPTGAKCRLPFAIPAVNLTLKNTIEGAFGERVQRRHDSETLPTAEALQARAAALEAHAKPDGPPTARRLHVSSLSICVSLLLAFFAGRSASPSLPRTSPEGLTHASTLAMWPSHGGSLASHWSSSIPLAPVPGPQEEAPSWAAGEAPPSGDGSTPPRTLFEWAQERAENRRLFIWQVRCRRLPTAGEGRRRVCSV